jgi:hypothetical protein
MFAKTRIALAAMAVVGVSSHAMAQSIAPNDDAPAAARPDIVAGTSPVTQIAWRKSPPSTHLRLRQSRNAGLNGYAPWSGQQADEPGYDSRLPSHRNNDDNYQYWRQACCL